MAPARPLGLECAPSHEHPAPPPPVFRPACRRGDAAGCAGAWGVTRHGLCPGQHRPLVGAVLGLWLSGQPLSVAALVGFITLAGISVRNGILKVSHYINLMRFEGESFTKPMILRGSMERLSPVLMTALVTAFALAPLLFEAERPGTEILHPVAVVIFSGLISSTLLDTFLTPAMFWLFGRKPAEALLQDKDAEAF